MKTIAHVLLAFICTCCNTKQSDNTEQRSEITRGITLTESQSKKIEPFFSKNVSSINFSKSLIEREPQSDEYYDYHSAIDTVNNLIRVTLYLPIDTVATTIELSGSLMGWADRILVDTHDNLGFITWISEPFYKSNPGSEGINPNHSIDLYLKTIDLVTKQVLFSDRVYSTKCCIDCLSMIYNPQSRCILFAYNDFSKPNKRNLMYGFLPLERGVPRVQKLNPTAIVLQDKSEKRWPHFLDNNHSIYLSHTTGDNWGFFEHTGMKQIGISSIGRDNRPTDYHVITDSLPINEKLVLHNDTLYYRIENIEGQMTIKKVALEDLTKHE